MLDIDSWTCLIVIEPPEMISNFLSYSKFFFFFCFSYITYELEPMYRQDNRITKPNERRNDRKKCIEYIHIHTTTQLNVYITHTSSEETRNEKMLQSSN